jgi:ABC-type lipoprotein release transport system permease subunit
LAIIVAIGAIVQILPDAYGVLRLSGFEQAAYDFRLSGNLEEADLAALRSSASVGEVLAAAIWSTRLASGEGDAVRSGMVVFVDDMARASRLMPVNPGGMAFDPGGMVLTSRLASELGVSEGDPVAMDWSDYDIGDPPTVTATVSGIVESGAEGEMAIVDDALAEAALTDAMNQLRAKGDLQTSQPRYTEFFVLLSQPVNDSWIFETIGGEPEEFSLEWRQDRLSTERQEVARLDNGTNGILKFVSACLYAVIALFFCGQRLVSRRKELAVLVAGGASRSALLAYVLADVLVLIIFASGLALLAAYVFFRFQLVFLLPGHLVGRVIVYGVVLDFAVMCLGAVLTLWQTRGSQISKALARVF